MKKENKSRYAVIWGIFILYTCYFMYLYLKLPLCHDDYAWAEPERVQMLMQLYQGYNGRLLGNIMILCLTRIKPLVVLGLPLILLMLLSAIYKITERKEDGNENHNLFLLLLTVFLMVGMPRDIYIQTVGWLSGFSNYIPPIVLFLIYFSQVKNMYFEGGEELGGKKLLGLMAVCFAAQLFSEHNTIFHCMFSGCILLYEWFFMKRKVRKCTLCFFGAYCAGFIFMFANTAYLGALFGESYTYKRIEFSIAVVFSRYYNLYDFALNLLMVLFCIILLWKNRTVKGILKAELILYMAAFECFAFYLKMHPHAVLLHNVELYKWILLILSFLFDLHVMAAAFLGVRNRRRIYIILFYLMAIAVTLPLIMANPIYFRCFLSAYVFRSVACIFLADQALETKNAAVILSLVIFAVCIGIGGHYVKGYTENAKCQEMREEIMEKCKDSKKKKVYLPLFPYDKYLFKPEPTPTFDERYKRYYGIPVEKKLKFRAYNRFLNHEF